MLDVQYLNVDVLGQLSRDQYRLTTSQELQVGSVVNVKAHAPQKKSELKTIVSIVECSIHKANRNLKVYNVLLEDYREQPIGSHEEESE
jgi:hypothetical protein